MAFLRNITIFYEFYTKFATSSDFSKKSSIFQKISVRI